MTVKQAQCLLLYLGYSPGWPDNVAGEKTNGAASAFQADYGLPVTGKLDETTCKMLIAAVAGTAVKVERPDAADQTTTDKAQAGTFWDNIRYFTREEFACKCAGKYCDGYPVEIDMNMVKIADQIREKIGKPITVNSGLRCKTHNASVGGVSNSQHLYGTAADLGCPTGCTPSQMASIAEEIMGNTGGIGIYSWGIHIDTRSAKSRWNG